MIGYVPNPIVGDKSPESPYIRETIDAVKERERDLKLMQIFPEDQMGDCFYDVNPDTKHAKRLPYKIYDDKEMRKRLIQGIVRPTLVVIEHEQSGRKQYFPVYSKSDVYTLKDLLKFAPDRNPDNLLPIKK
jgi:hypothetical protein